MQYERMKKRELIDYIKKIESGPSGDTLQEQDDVWKMTFDSIPDMVSIQDTEFNIIKVNRAYAETLGLEPSEILGRKCYEIIHNTDCPYHECPVPEVLKQGKSAEREYFEPRLQKHIEVSASPIFDSRGIFSGIVHIVRDKTGAKNAEAEIRSLARFPEENPNPILRISRENKVIYSNKPGEHLLRYLECDGDGILQGKWGDLIQVMFDTGRKQTHEIDTEGRIYSLTFSPVEDEDYLNVYGLDITSSKKTAEAVMEREETFRQIFTNAVDGILLADPETGVFYSANSSMCEMTGYTISEMEHMGLADIHPAEDLPYVREQFERQAKNEITLAPNLPVKRKDGTVFYADVNTAPVLINGKQYLMGFFRDVSEKKQAEDIAREMAQTLELALRVSNVGLWDWNMAENKLYFSPEWKKQIGYEPDEVDDTYEFWESHLHPEDREAVLSDLQAYIENRSREYAVEFRFLHKDGSWIWVTARGEVIRNDSGIPVRMLGCHVDITDLKEGEHELRREKEKLERFTALAVDREHRMIELKKRIRELEEKLDEYAETGSE